MLLPFAWSSLFGGSALATDVKACSARLGFESVFNGSSFLGTFPVLPAMGGELFLLMVAVPVADFAIVFKVKERFGPPWPFCLPVVLALVTVPTERDFPKADVL